MKKLKKVLALGLAAVMTMSLAACGSQSSKDEVIATVNGKEIYKSDYDNLYNEYVTYFGDSAETRAYLSEQKGLLVQELVSNEVLFQKAEELGITCTDEALEEAYAAVEAEYGKEVVAQMLAYSQMTEADYKAMMRDQIVMGKLQEVMIGETPVVTNEEIQKHYEENREDYTIGKGANMKHILVQAKEEGQEAAAKEAVATIQAELAAGTSFETLYEKYGKQGEENSLYVVEDLGFVTYEEPNFDPDFLKGVKQVEEGQISAPIKSSFGEHFVKVEGITEKRVLPLEEVKENVKAVLIEEKEYALYMACLEKWIEEAEVTTYEERI